MPWTCVQCAVELLDQQNTCPTCGAAKTSWTVQAGQTRRFQLSTGKLEVLRGASDEPAEAIPAVPKQEARAWEGEVPASGCVRLRVHGSKRQVGAGVLFEEREAGDHALDLPAREEGASWVELTLVCVYGEGEPPSCEGAAVLDVSEGEGWAPALELGWVGKPGRELPLVGPTPLVLVLSGEELPERSGTFVLSDAAEEALVEIDLAGEERLRAEETEITLDFGLLPAGSYSLWFYPAERGEEDGYPLFVDLPLAELLAEPSPVEEAERERDAFAADEVWKELPELASWDLSAGEDEDLSEDDFEELCGVLEVSAEELSL